MASKKPSEGPGLFDQLLRPTENPEEAPAPPADQPLTVAELTERIKGSLLGLGRFAVEGELTRITRAASGHVYFQLKDEKASISCIVWRGQVARATAGVKPEEGQKILVRGSLDVYAPRGGYSLIVDAMEPIGIGAQLAQLEALKAELREAGWFDRARPLPTMPRRVGIVTSRDTAALRDFLRTRSMRWPGYPVRLIHTPVQGPTAAGQIAAAIDLATGERFGGDIDVLVVTRGGGSLEDLWCFNERVVAEAIHRSPVPVISGVGHETDTTLADLVADHRAHTPTDAAQTVIPDRGERVEKLERLAGYMDRAVEERLALRVGRLEACASARVLASAGWILGDRAERLEGLLRRQRLAAGRRVEQAAAQLAASEARLERGSPRARLDLTAQRTASLAARLVRLGAGLSRGSERRLELAARGLDGISPLKVLARGYSTTAGPDGTLLRAAEDVAVGDQLETRLGLGRLRSQVTEVLGEDEA
ncbi:MAG: exodeoxyribonuclease VII large subunit [Planctomycetota bacterium]|nr:exodeoxyribonuclease VII large subunit [Planctomycetota bacterium]